MVFAGMRMSAQASIWAEPILLLMAVEYALACSPCPARTIDGTTELLGLASVVLPQDGASSKRLLRREVNGYRVEDAKIKVKKAKKGSTSSQEEPVRLGEAQVVSLSPLGATMEVKVTIAPLEERGEIDSLVFEDVRIDGTPVTIDPYEHSFKIPEDEPLTLPNSLKVYMNSPNVVLGELGDLFSHKDQLAVTGRVYACGRFKRFSFKFKRAVPLDLAASIKNPF
jgi:hypothetical protein